MPSLRHLPVRLITANGHTGELVRFRIAAVGEKHHPIGGISPHTFGEMPELSWIVAMDKQHIHQMFNRLPTTLQMNCFVY